MLHTGVTTPNYPNDAHHIVAGNAARAEEARTILNKFHIDINDAANGVFLPSVKGVSDATYHYSLNNNTAYYEKVNELLRQATSRQEALDILKYIGNELSNGTFLQ